MTRDEKYYKEARAGKLNTLRCDDCEHFNKNTRFCKKLKHHLRTTDAIIDHSSRCGDKFKD